MNILVFIETSNRHLKKTELEILSYANSLKMISKGTLTALVLPDAGSEAIECMAKYGAEKILILKSEIPANNDISCMAEAIKQAVIQKGIETVIFTGSIRSRAVAPILSAKLKAGMVQGVYSLPITLNPFTIYRKVFSGKAVASVIVKTAVKILVTLPNSFKITENPVNLNTEDFNPEPSGDTSPWARGIKVLDMTLTKEQARLTEAGIVVSGGRGLKSRENWKYVEELAGLLGAATACSRPAYDEGWCPHDGYVGQTGKVISPKVYFALGISGAVQHLAGIASSRLLVAVNKDPEAPIFKSADYGIIGDIQDVMPRLINDLKEYKARLMTGQEK